MSNSKNKIKVILYFFKLSARTTVPPPSVLVTVVLVTAELIIEVLIAAVPSY